MSSMKKEIIAYDITIIPDGMTFDVLVSIKDKFGILFYDSYRMPDRKPYVLTGKPSTMFVDVSEAEGQLKLKKLLEKLRE